MEKKYCEYCNSELAENAIFCGNCGAEVLDKKQVKYCYKCGETLKEDAKFCIKCGCETLKNEEDIPVEVEKISFIEHFRKISSSNLILTIAILSSILVLISLVTLSLLNVALYTMLSVSCFVLWRKGKKGKDQIKTIKLFKTTSIIGMIGEIILMLFIIGVIGIVLYVIQTQIKGQETLVNVLTIIISIAGVIGIGISVVLMILLFKAIFKLIKGVKKSLENNTDFVSDKLMFPAILLIIIGGSSVSSTFSSTLTLESDVDTLYEVFPRDIVEILERVMENLFLSQISVAIVSTIVILFGILLLKFRTSLKNN